MKYITDSQLTFWRLKSPQLQPLTDANLRYCLNRMLYWDDTYQYWCDRVDSYLFTINQYSRDQHSYSLRQHHGTMKPSSLLQRLLLEHRKAGSK